MNINEKKRLRRPKEIKKERKDRTINRKRDNKTSGRCQNLKHRRQVKSDTRVE